MSAELSPFMKQIVAAIDCADSSMVAGTEVISGMLKKDTDEDLKVSEAQINTMFQTILDSVKDCAADDSEDIVFCMDSEDIVNMLKSLGIPLTTLAYLSVLSSSMK